MLPSLQADVSTGEIAAAEKLDGPAVDFSGELAELQAAISATAEIAVQATSGFIDGLAGAGARTKRDLGRVFAAPGQTRMNRHQNPRPRKRPKRPTSSLLHDEIRMQTPSCPSRRNPQEKLNFAKGE